MTRLADDAAGQLVPGAGHTDQGDYLRVAKSTVHQSFQHARVLAVMQVHHAPHFAAAAGAKELSV